ncbi:hypothetical protein L5515_007169 [Caenorhabditis briggsae]|uniref:Uncharacterized protein n=1 Tax=Caenorhabditis briggsae TaxID=6238 RepID=A0AAE9JLU5_CAEBR|nr:hypothetical protein L5515_007169 [Caenorhabditis briggsae]
MKSVKGMMLLMHLCGAYLDLFISALSNQYFVFPAAAGYTQGLYTYLGVPIRWQGYMYVNGLCLTGVSILGFFENRFTAVVRVGNYVFAVVFIFPITFTAPEQTYGKAYVREFFIALSIQIIIPICAIIGPVGYIAFACATSHFDQALNNIFVNVIAFHGLISSVVMLGVHKPYRQAVFGMVKCAYLGKKLMGSSVHVEGTTAVVLSSKRPSIHPQVYIGPGHNYFPVD